MNWIVCLVWWSDISYIYYYFLPLFTVSCMKLVIFYSILTFSYTKYFVQSYTVDVVFTLSYWLPYPAWIMIHMWNRANQKRTSKQMYWLWRQNCSTTQIIFQCSLTVYLNIASTTVAPMYLNNKYHRVIYIYILFTELFVLLHTFTSTA